MGSHDPHRSPLDFTPCLECGAGYGEGHWPACGMGAAARAGRTPPVEPGQGGDMLGECLRRGWWCIDVPGDGWRPALARDRGAIPDAARYRYWLEHGDAALEGAESAAEGRGPAG